MSRENPEFLVGDRVVHLEDPSHEGEARNGEQGTIVHLDPADDVISWDVALATTWNVDDGPSGWSGCPSWIGSWPDHEG